MSLRYVAGYLSNTYNPIQVPDAPVIGTATVTSNTSVSVTFIAPSDSGGSPITSYVAVATDSSTGQTFIGTGAASPITVSGLTTNNTYTVKVAAVNSYGASAYSAASNSVVVYIVIGQVAYISPGTYSWTCPADVTSVSVVCVGGGGGGGSAYYNSTGAGGGGGLRYGNNITVTPGTSYTVVVGSGGSGGTNSPNAGGDSSFNSSVIASGATGQAGGGAGSGGTAGYAGGNGGTGSAYCGGGGAAGYAGVGGQGQSGNTGQNATAGSGGGGGGGSHYAVATNYSGGGGGGVGLLGEGTSGAAGTYGDRYDCGGRGGSDGQNGTPGPVVGGDTRNQPGQPGGAYGGGGGQGRGSTTNSGGAGGGGAVRIIWPGNVRYFPSTDTGDL